MRSMHEMLSNIVIVSGLVLSAGSLHDALSVRTREQTAREDGMRTSLVQKYGIRTVCYPTPFSFGMYCEPTAPAARSTEEQERTLNQYRSDLAVYGLNRPSRMGRDVIGALTGGLVTGAGVLARKRRR